MWCHPQTKLGQSSYVELSGGQVIYLWLVILLAASSSSSSPNTRETPSDFTLFGPYKKKTSLSQLRNHSNLTFYTTGTPLRYDDLATPDLLTISTTSPVHLQPEIPRTPPTPTMCRTKVDVLTGHCPSCQRPHQFKTSFTQQCQNPTTNQYFEVHDGSKCQKGFKRDDEKAAKAEALQIVVGKLGEACDNCRGRETPVFREEVGSDEEV